MVAKDYRLLGFILLAILVAAPGCGGGSGGGGGGSSSCGLQTLVVTNGYTIDHTCTTLASIPESAINNAKQSLYIVYWHTSHGSQLVSGMQGLESWKGVPYNLENGAVNLRLAEPASTDLGNSNWDNVTRTYLDQHSEVNVVIWSWCGQVSSATEASIISYLNLMNGLEQAYPGIKFVYMTGHLDGTGLAGNLHQRNEQIRTYCRNNHKWLYDFADIESFDPDGTDFRARNPHDSCDYDNGLGGHGNWAVEWQNAHTVNVCWYQCSAAHTQALNGNRKAYAAWWLWARLAGWNGP